MERSSKRGKIPQQDWPSIIERYEKGETLASIARTYDCSPPAISYILSRSRARAAAAPAAAPAAETSNAAASPRGADFAPQAARPAAPATQAGRIPEGRIGEAIAAPEQGKSTAPRQERVMAAADPSPLRSPAPPDNAAGNGAQNGEARRTLHLSHGYANGPERNGPERNGEASSDRGLDTPLFARQPAAPPPSQPSAHHPAAPLPAPGNGASVRAMAEPQQHKEGGAIDRALRERVHTDLTAFLAAFDAALADDTCESRAALREATDRLLRAGARTRIELERLEARLPLPPRDRPAAMTPAWRQR